MEPGGEDELDELSDWLLSYWVIKWVLAILITMYYL